MRQVGFLAGVEGGDVAFQLVQRGGGGLEDFAGFALGGFLHLELCPIEDGGAHDHRHGGSLVFLGEGDQPEGAGNGGEDHDEIARFDHG